MVKAIPIDKSGNQIGEAKNFSDMRWDKMKAHFGKNLAWKEVGAEYKPSVIQSGEAIKEVELMAAPVSTKKAKSKKKNEK